MGDDNIQKSLFIKNGIMLTLFSLLIRSISMGFRIWLAGGLGEKGLGLYQLILSVYAFFALMATSGLNITCTRLTGEQLASDDFVIPENGSGQLGWYWSKWGPQGILIRFKFTGQDP